MKKALSIVLCLVMLLGTVAIGGSVLNLEASAATTYKTGDYIYFGTYPQIDVTASMGEALTALAGDNKNWTSYGYYSGTGKFDDDKMVASDYMRYTDITYRGEKYRGVTFDSYRPIITDNTSSTSTTFQDNNGYTPNNVYWFKYEPIKWRVLDPSTGLVMCDMAIDSQAYNNYVWSGVGSLSSSSEYYGNSDHTYYASNYAQSSIRQWLNNDFYNTAFSSEQKSNILTSTLNNNGYYSLTGVTGYEYLDCASTNDKVFLLSYNEIINVSYGFSSESVETDTTKYINGTDYAMSQGLEVAGRNCSWWLRSPGDESGSSCSAKAYGDPEYGTAVSITKIGVVPALRLQNLKSEALAEVSINTEIYYGTYPQSKVTDTATLSALNAMNLTWHSYNYYAKNTDTSIMDYTDVDYNGNRYRGVKINSYRPEIAIRNAGDASNSRQDENGYTTGNIYWFLWEPVKWTAIPFGEKYCLITDIIIDSQPFQAPTYNESGVVTTGGSYQSDGKTKANAYATSTIKAFIDALQADGLYQFNTIGVGVKNIGLYCADTSSLTGYTASGSDYAKCQGLDCRNSNGNSPWFTGYSNGASNETGTGRYGADGSTDNNFSIVYTSVGTRLCISPANLSNTFVSDSSATVPTSHNFYKYVSDKKGNHTAYCSECDYSETVACIMGEATQISAPTCTTAGVNESKCTLCGYTKQSAGAPATNHSWGDYTYNGESAKTHTRVCATDSAHTETANCTFDDGVVTNAASCTETGVMTYTCSGCNGTYTEAIDKASHTPKAAAEEDRVEATCTTAGSYNLVVRCKDCNTILSSEAKTIPALNHSFTKYVSDENASCLDDGTKTAKCDRCDVTDTVTDWGTAKGHKLVNHDAKAPTCTEVGWSAYRTCENCDYTNYAEIPVTDHIEGEPEKVYYKDKTCVDDGTYVMVTKCTVCGEELNRSDIKSEVRLGHYYSEYISNNDANCERDGTKTAKCIRCDKTITVADEGTAIGHADKNKDGICDNCGMVRDPDLVNPCRNAKIKVAAAKTVDYKTKVTIKATATGVPDGYILVMIVNGKEIKGTNTEVTYEAGNITSDINYTVKVVDAEGNVQRDADGNLLTKDGGKITCNSGFFKKLIAFFKGLFGSLPTVEIKP